MKSFKNFIKESEKNESFKQDDKGRWVIAPNLNYGNKKRPFKQDDKGRWVIPPNLNYGNKRDKLKESILFEIYHTPTEENELHYSNSDNYTPMNDALNNYHNDASSNWNSDDYSNIRKYTEGSSSIADILHQFHNGEASKSDIDYKRDHINGLDSALNRAKPAPFDYHVYHGIKFNPQDLFDKQDESQRSSSGKISARLQGSSDDSAVMHLPAYTSTSLNAKVAKNFSEPDRNNVNHILKFRIPMGSTHGAHIDEHSEYGIHSYTDSEYETLLKRGTNFKMSKTPEIIGNTHIWHCEILGQDPKDVNPKISRYASEEELHNLSKSEDPEIRSEVAAHTNTSGDTLHRMAMDKSNNKPTLQNIALNLNTKTHTLNHLSDIGDDDINKNIVHHPNIDSHTLNKLATPSSSAPLLQRISEHPKTNLSTLNDIYNHSLHRLGVASSLATNKNSDDELLHKIALNTGKATHDALIGNKNTSNKTLHHILDNSEDYPRDNYDGYNPGLLDHQNADSSLVHKLVDKNKNSSDYTYHDHVLPYLVSSKHADNSLLHKVASFKDLRPSTMNNIAIHNKADDNLREKMYERSKHSPMASFIRDNFRSKLLLSDNTHTNLLHKMVTDDPNHAKEYSSLFLKHKNADDELKNRIKELNKPI
jgi:hypothetical protein